jgi:hypothetical protein
VTLDPTGRKWSHITDTAYEGAARFDFGVYRPAKNCLMRNLDWPFCPVCTDVIRRKLESFMTEVPAEEPPAPQPESPENRSEIAILFRDFRRGKVVREVGRSFDDTEAGAEKAIEYLKLQKLK